VKQVNSLVPERDNAKPFEAINIAISLHAYERIKFGRLPSAIAGVEKKIGVGVFDHQPAQNLKAAVQVARYYRQHKNLLIQYYHIGWLFSR
jgi:hypothetical protein